MELTVPYIYIYIYIYIQYLYNKLLLTDLLSLQAYILNIKYLISTLLVFTYNFLNI